MFQTVRYLFVKELIQTLRDKRMRMTLIVPPIFQLIVFGYAANLDVKHIRTAVRDLDQSVESRDLIGRFGSSKYFDIVSFPNTPREVKDLINQGEVTVSIEIPTDFSRKLKKGDTATVQIVLDGTESNTALIALGYANQILSDFSTQMLVKRLNRAGMIGFEQAGVDLQQRIWFNPNFESRLFYVPGVIASIAFLIPIILTAQAIVREREIGTLEQIMVTPIRSWELMLGKTLPFALFGLFDVMMIALIGVFWFEVPLRGNPLVLLLGAVPLSDEFSGHWTLYFHHLLHPTTGSDFYLLFHDACFYPIRFCLSDREYARMDPIPDLCQPAPLLSWSSFEASF